MFNTRGELIVCLTKVFRQTPFSITSFDLDTFATAIVFTWKGVEYSANLGGIVYEIKATESCITDRSIMLQQLIKYERYAD